MKILELTRDLLRLLEIPREAWVVPEVGGGVLHRQRHKI